MKDNKVNYPLTITSTIIGVIYIGISIWMFSELVNERREMSYRFGGDAYRTCLEALPWLFLTGGISQFFSFSEKNKGGILATIIINVPILYLIYKVAPTAFGTVMFFTFIISIILIILLASEINNNKNY